MKEQSWIAGVAWLLLTAGSMQAENIALNLSGSGFPDPTPSDVGWGMGSNKWDINDGKRFLLDTNVHGLAFLMGTGTRNAIIDFGTPSTFEQVVLWHHGYARVPTTVDLAYWDGSAWNAISSYSRAVREMEYSGAGNSFSDNYVFATPVTGSKVRWSYDAAQQKSYLGYDFEHAWIYEFEVFYPVENIPEPSTLASIFTGLGAMGLIVAWRRRKRAA